MFTKKQWMKQVAVFKRKSTPNVSSGHYGAVKIYEFQMNQQREWKWHLSEAALSKQLRNPAPAGIIILPLETENKF